MKEAHFGEKTSVIQVSKVVRTLWYFPVGQPLVLWRPPPRGAHESEPWKWGDSLGMVPCSGLYQACTGLIKVLEGLGLGFEVWKPYRVDMVTLMRYNDVHAFLGLQ